MTKRLPLILSIAAYAGAILSANLLTSHYRDVSVGFGLTAAAGTYAAGFALLARDYVHRYGGVAWALAAITIGAVASYVLTDPFLAFASTAAFVAAELVDLGVFGRVRASAGFVIAVLVSNLVSAPVDTFAFLQLAGFPITPEIVGGQLVGKLAWATLVPLAAWVLTDAARRRTAVTA